jgi:23S rRNA (pseudouridine1915-N3)-methyltransferase
MLKITLIACGNKMPDWVNIATKTFLQRLQEYVQFKLIELPPEKRIKSQSEAVYLEKEATKIQQVIPTSSYWIALDSQGERFTSEKLALKLEKLQLQAPHWCFIIGGPDGISPILLEKMQERWSLSDLTFPHPLARIVLLEALYRAFSILHAHPYHR